MVHCSGMHFEGLWINGTPSALAVKLVIVNVGDPLEVMQGVPFDLEIQCQNKDCEIVEGKTLLSVWNNSLYCLYIPSK